MGSKGEGCMGSKEGCMGSKGGCMGSMMGGRLHGFNDGGEVAWVQMGGDLENRADCLRGDQVGCMQLLNFLFFN